MAKLKLLAEVLEVPQDNLQQYIMGKALRIAEATPPHRDEWDDPEDWMDDAVLLAHAVVRFLR